jgi:uncharacterized membrane protein
MRTSDRWREPNPRTTSLLQLRNRNPVMLRRDDQTIEGVGIGCRLATLHLVPSRGIGRLCARPSPRHILRCHPHVARAEARGCSAFPPERFALACPAWRIAMANTGDPQTAWIGAMDKSRLEAFSDGVIAIIITIMVLELKAPHGVDLGALIAVAPTFLSYVLSFVYVAIYWHNHHHLLKVRFRVDGLILWANTHLLFWLSLIPFATAWLAESHYASVPAAIYGVSLLMPSVAFLILQSAIIRAQGRDSELRKAVGADWKGKISIAAYLLAIMLTYADARLALAVYVLMAVVWLVPDRRIEKRLREGA